MAESMSTNFRRKYHVDIKAMFWNGCHSYLNLLRPPSKKNINSWINKNIGVKRTAISKDAPSDYQVLVVEHWKLLKVGQFHLSDIWWGRFSSCKCNFDFVGMNHQPIIRIVILLIYSKKVQTQTALRYAKFGNWKWTSLQIQQRKKKWLVKFFFFFHFLFQIVAELKIYSDNVTQ